jgi:hypothetical protein
LAPPDSPLQGLILLCKKTVITAKILTKFTAEINVWFLHFFANITAVRFDGILSKLQLNIRYKMASFFHRDFYGQKSDEIFGRNENFFSKISLGNYGQNFKKHKK